MTNAVNDDLKQTPLHDEHIRLGARMVEFVGWHMPVYYSGTIDEHMAVRTRAGLFDVSHMGEIEISGVDGPAFVQKLTPNDAIGLEVGRAHYSALTTQKGTFVDDVLVYRLEAERFMLCVNAANRSKDYRWILDHASGRVEVIDRSDDFAQLALQGPKAKEILQRVTDYELKSIKYYRFAEMNLLGSDVILSRTGYTGEDGFEIYAPPEGSVEIWNALLDEGKEENIKPIGLGARDTLRLEAKMALYGNDITEDTTVWEAGLDWIVKMDKGDFVGRSALEEQKREGIKRRLVGFEMVGRGIARHGYPVLIDGEEVGHVTSGSFAPFLKKNNGLTYLPLDHSEVDVEFDVLIRGKPIRARVVETPFYKRKKKAKKAPK